MANVEVKKMMEAKIFGKYILGREPDQQAVDLYHSATAEINFGKISAKDERVLRFALKNPSFLGPVDAALALSRQGSLLRKKLHVMFAVLEAQPQYAHLFLPEKRTHNSLFFVFWAGTRAVLKALVGKIILVFI